jgi:hypothetical protein
MGALISSSWDPITKSGILTCEDVLEGKLDIAGIEG